jgi:hypothetical protein
MPLTYVSIYAWLLARAVSALQPDAGESALRHAFGRGGAALVVDAKAGIAEVGSDQGDHADLEPAEEGTPSLLEFDEGSLEEEDDEAEIPPEDPNPIADPYFTRPVSIGPGYARRRYHNYYLGTGGTFTTTRTPLRFLLVAGPGGLNSMYAICQMGCEPGVMRACTCLMKQPPTCTHECPVSWGGVPVAPSNMTVPAVAFHWQPMETSTNSGKYVLMSRQDAPSVLGLDLPAAAGLAGGGARPMSKVVPRWGPTWSFYLQLLQM